MFKPKKDQLQVPRALDQHRHQVTGYGLVEDACLLAAAIGRAERLLDHLYIQRADTSGSARLLPPSPWELDLEASWEESYEVLSRFGLRRVIPVLVSKEEELQDLLACLNQGDLEPLELLTRLLVLDDLVCALRAVDDYSSASERLAEVVEAVRYRVPARVTVCASIAQQARRFVERHGPTGRWGEMWREVARAEEALAEADSTYS